MPFWQKLKQKILLCHALDADRQVLGQESVLHRLNADLKFSLFFLNNRTQGKHHFGGKDIDLKMFETYKKSVPFPSCRRISPTGDYCRV